MKGKKVAKFTILAETWSGGFTKSLVGFYMCKENAGNIILRKSTQPILNGKKRTGRFISKLKEVLISHSFSFFFTS